MLSFCNPSLVPLTFKQRIHFSSWEWLFCYIPIAPSCFFFLLWVFFSSFPCCLFVFLSFYTCRHVSQLSGLRFSQFTVCLFIRGKVSSEIYIFFFHLGLLCHVWAKISVCPILFLKWEKQNTCHDSYKILHDVPTFRDVTHNKFYYASCPFTRMREKAYKVEFLAV